MPTTPEAEQPIRVPMCAYYGVAFIVDLMKLDDPEDISSDDMGVWRYNGIDTSYIKVARDAEKQVKSVTTCTLENPFTYKLKRCYCIHGTDSTLRKITSTFYGMPFE